MKYSILLSFIIIGVLFGCSTDMKPFRGDKVIFKVVHAESNSEFESYTFEVTNNTGYELSHLIFYMNYPIITPNGSMNNPFVIEGEVDSNITNPIKLKSGESIKFSIFCPIKEVFRNTDLLDTWYPNIELKGYIKEGFHEIPFGVYRSLSDMVDN
ncbi:MAG: hypothetical protein ACK4M9_19360 [Anaerobacillus sp.]|uniref:hypothetical protein n=1 Tax=Anaerobacillus sp. TaxID=1872506 RepID=UPI003918EFB0